MSSHTPQDKASDDAEKAARKQRRFVREQYNARYQNTMLDMKNAGLNPILAYQQGVGTPGAAASGQGFMGEGAGSIMGGIGSMMGAGASQSQASSQKKLRTQQGLLVGAQTSAQEAAGRQSDSQTRLNDATAIGAVHNARAAGTAADFLELERARREREAAFDESLPGRVLGHIGRATGLVGPAVGGLIGYKMGAGRNPTNFGAGRGPGPSQWKIQTRTRAQAARENAEAVRARAAQAAQRERWMNDEKAWQSPRRGR